MRKLWIVLAILALLALGFLLAYVWQQRKALQAVAKNRGALGGLVGAVGDAGALYDDAKSIFSNLKG